MDGYLLPNAVQVTVPATGAATGLSIVVSKGGSISGTVRTQINNSDISGTTVTATNTSDQTLYPVTTDASGNYDITDLPEGTYDLTVGGDPWETQYLSGIQISNGSTVSAENFTLAAGASVNGQVVVNGTPVADAFVGLTDSDGNTVSTTTDTNGHYTFSGLSAGAYTENVSAEGYARSSAPVTLVSGTTTTAASVSLSPGNTLAVTLLGPSSNVPTNGIVELDQAGQLVAISYVNAQGQVDFSGLSDGIYQLQMSADDLASMIATVNLSGGETVTSTYQLTVGCLVRGTVTDGNLAPISNMLLNLSGTDTSGNPIVSEAITGSDGTYQFPNLQPGTYTVTVGNDEGIDLQDTTLTAGAPDSTLNFTVAGAVIQGTVLSAGGTTPVGLAKVILTQAGQTVADAQTDNSGDYSIRGLAAGTYTLLATAAGDGITASQTVTVSANQVTSVSPLVFGNISFSGVVENETGQPIDNATIQLEPAISVADGTTPLATSAADGSFSIAGLVPGQYTLLATSSNYAALMESVTITGSSASNQTIVVQSGVGVSGEITDASSGQPIGQALVSFLDPATHAALASALSDANGHFVTPHLSPGTYNVLVSQGSYQNQELVGVQIHSNPFTLNVSMSAQTTTLQGVATDGSGHPLPNAAIAVVNNAGDTVALLMSGPDGSFSTRQLPPGVYTIQARLVGYFPAQASGVVIASGNTATQNLSLAVAGTDDHLIIDPKSGNLIVVPDDVHQGEANLDTRVSQATGKPTPDPDDPNFSSSPLPHASCAPAIEGEKAALQAMKLVASCYEAWNAAYNNEQSVETYNTLIIGTDIVNSFFSLIGDLATGWGGSACNRRCSRRWA